MRAAVTEEIRRGTMAGDPTVVLLPITRLVPTEAEADQPEAEEQAVTDVAAEEQAVQEDSAKADRAAAAMAADAQLVAEAVDTTEGVAAEERAPQEVRQAAAADQAILPGQELPIHADSSKVTGKY